MARRILETIARNTKSINQYIENHGFTWGEVQRFLEHKKIVLQDTDLLQIGYQEEEQSHEDAWSPACYFIELRRWRDPTEEEKRKWKEQIEKAQERSKKERYEQYLKLKKEFENDEI